MEKLKAVKFQEVYVLPTVTEETYVYLLGSEAKRLYGVEVATLKYSPLLATWTQIKFVKCGTTTISNSAISQISQPYYNYNSFNITNTPGGKSFLSLSWGNITGTLSNQTDLQTALNAKQNTLTFDTTPTLNSTNPVTSGGIYTALETKAD